MRSENDKLKEELQAKHVNEISLKARLEESHEVISRLRQDAEVNAKHIVPLQESVKFVVGRSRGPAAASAPATVLYATPVSLARSSPAASAPVWRRLPLAPSTVATPSPPSLSAPFQLNPPATSYPSRCRPNLPRPHVARCPAHRATSPPRLTLLCVSACSHHVQVKSASPEPTSSVLVTWTAGTVGGAGARQV